MLQSKKALLFIFILFLARPSAATDFYADIRKKQMAKDAKRWSLSEWLDQKKNLKLMDMWLSYNKPSPYEFFLSADTASLETTVSNAASTSDRDFRSYRGAFGAYATVVGLYGEYEHTDEVIDQWKALFLLRLLGSSDQSTNLTLQYGLMNRKFAGTDEIQHQVGGAKMDLYLLRAFALTGRYEHILKAESKNEISIEGYRVEGGAHIEYGAMRIYGTWFDERLELIDALSAEWTQRRSGILFGTRFYF